MSWKNPKNGVNNGWFKKGNKPVRNAIVKQIIMVVKEIGSDLGIFYMKKKKPKVKPRFKIKLKDFSLIEKYYKLVFL